MAAQMRANENATFDSARMFGAEQGAGQVPPGLRCLVDLKQVTSQTPGETRPVA
jgi:hypothetical protein